MLQPEVQIRRENMEPPSAKVETPDHSQVIPPPPRKKRRKLKILLAVAAGFVVVAAVALSGWRRYNHDGYGQKDDGSAFDGKGVGRCWPILTGERGHYELAAGRDPKPFIAALQGFANEGGMISEQLWDADDLKDVSMKRGSATGAAMPLC
jgi:GH15 family glucan-1,4-alpha-glucosidase